MQASRIFLLESIRSPFPFFVLPFLFARSVMFLLAALPFLLCVVISFLRSMSDDPQNIVQKTDNPSLPSSFVSFRKLSFRKAFSPIVSKFHSFYSLLRSATVNSDRFFVAAMAVYSASRQDLLYPTSNTSCNVFLFTNLIGLFCTH